MNMKIHAYHVFFQAGLRCDKAIGEWSIKSYVRENRWLAFSFYSPAYFGEDENEKQKVEVIHLSKVALLHLNGTDAGLLDLDGESITFFDIVFLSPSKSTSINSWMSFSLAGIGIALN